MKFLKVSHKIAKLIYSGEKNNTWRINDEKNVSVDDVIGIVDKINPDDLTSWKIIGTGKVSEVLQKRLSDIEQGDLGVGEDFESKDQMLRTFRKYYGGDISERTPVKIITFDFTPQEPRPLADIEDKNTTDLTEVKLYADGGSRGNPGPSASGYVLMTMDDIVVFEGGQYMGITTNNQAEYNALKLGLQEALNRGAKQIHIYMDSLLVVNQIKGLYKVRNRDLAPVHQAINILMTKFEKVTITHVPREHNKLADGMVNEILDASLA